MINGQLGCKKSLNIFKSISVVKCKKIISSSFIIIRSFNFLAKKKKQTAYRQLKIQKVLNLLPILLNIQESY